MVELDWELIKSADINVLANDEDAAEEYFGFLSKVCYLMIRQYCIMYISNDHP